MLELDKIYNMDCIGGLKQLDNESIDLVIIDPPYSSGTRQATNRTAGAIPKRGERWAKAGIIWDSSFSSFGLSLFLNHFFRKIIIKMKEKSHIYTFIDWRHYPLLTMSLEGSGLFINNLIVWDKGMYTLGGNYRSQYELIVFASRGKARRLNTTTQGNVFNFKRVVNGQHPTEKPVDLVRTIVKYASNENDLVLDAFMGGGTTAIACKQTNRRYIGFEINNEYCKIANKRLANVSEKLDSFSQVNDGLNTIVHRNEQVRNVKLTC